MKIRLDSLEIIQETQEIPQAQILSPKEPKTQQESPAIVKEQKPKERIHNMQFGNATDYVLTINHRKTNDIT